MPLSCVIGLSFANEVQGDFASMRRTPVLEQVNALPCPQGEPPLQDRDRKMHTRQRGANVGGHVIEAFVRVPVSSGVLGREAVEECLKIGANVGRGVLLDEQSGRGMPAKKRQEPGLDAMGPQPIQDVGCNLDKPAAAG